MKVSLNAVRWLNQQYNCAAEPAPGGVEKLVERIGSQLGAVEAITDVGSMYGGAVIVRIVSCEPHPNADRLHVCQIDDGYTNDQNNDSSEYYTPIVNRDVNRDVTRLDNGFVQVVCGAPNVRAGMAAVWLPPGVTVPSSYGSEPFVLAARELRGVVSNGMLASPKELALSDSHDGILEIDDDVEPGTAFADAYNFHGDMVIDIENKMFTHRPDCFGLLGVAREIAGIQDMPFKSPDWYRTDAVLPAAAAPKLMVTVDNQLPKLVPHFIAVALDGIKVGPSPIWLQTRLSRLGIRPINNVVDLTNFYMIETGQPLHAYDYDKITSLSDDGVAHFIIRQPLAEEKLTLLSGKTITPRPEAIVIAGSTVAIGLGGVMGGANSEIDAQTTKIVLECASFDMYSIRKTAMVHGLFSDAVTRYTKGQSPLQNRAVLAKIVNDFVQRHGATVASTVVDDSHLSSDVLERKSLHPDVIVEAKFINSRLGLELPVETIVRLLTNVEFLVQAKTDQLTVRAPFWRTDIEIPEDVVEEVGRLYGYDKLPLALPQKPIAPAVKDAVLQTKQRVRELLAAAGANETLNYSFVPESVLRKAGQDPAQAFKISNALSPDLQYYRLSLLPSLLEKVHANVRAGYDRFALFELGVTHTMQAMANGLPTEAEHLSFVYTADAKAKPAGAAYYQALNYLRQLLTHFGLHIVLAPLAASTDAAIQPFASARSAMVSLMDGSQLGVVGELKPEVRAGFKLPPHSAGFEIDISVLTRQHPPYMSYTALPKYPKVSQDICLRVASKTTYQTVYDLVYTTATEQLSDALISLTAVDIYVRPDDVEHKQVTLRLEAALYVKTMTDAEISAVLETVSRRAGEQFQAERV